MEPIQDSVKWPTAVFSNIDHMNWNNSGADLLKNAIIMARNNVAVKSDE
jgi:hypothetical protein